MPKYVVLYTSPVSAGAQMENNDPEMAAAGMKAWNEWSAKAGSGVVDLGLPLSHGRKLTSGGAAEAGTEVAGYSILQADTMEAAEELLKSHPHLQMPGTAIEVYESMQIPGM
jgi:hypothetical protein